MHHNLSPKMAELTSFFCEYGIIVNVPLDAPPPQKDCICSSSGVN